LAVDQKHWTSADNNEVEILNFKCKINSLKNSENIKL